MDKATYHRIMASKWRELGFFDALLRRNHVRTPMGEWEANAYLEGGAAAASHVEPDDPRPALHPAPAGTEGGEG